MGVDCFLPVRCAEPCRAACQGVASGSPPCLSCVGQCTTASAPDSVMGTHNPMEDLRATFVQSGSDAARSKHRAKRQRHRQHREVRVQRIAQRKKNKRRHKEVSKIRLQ